MTSQSSKKGCVNFLTGIFLFNLTANLKNPHNFSIFFRKMAVAVQFSNRNYDGAVTKIHELLIDCDNFDVDIIDTVRSEILSIPLVKEMFQYYLSHNDMTSKTANTLLYIASICDYSEGMALLLVNDSVQVQIQIIINPKYILFIP